MLNLAHHALAGAIDISLVIVDSLFFSIGCRPVELQAMGALLKLKVYLFDGDGFRAIGNPGAFIVLV